MRRTLTALALSTLFAVPAFAHTHHTVKRNPVVAGDQAKDGKAESKPAEGSAPAEGTKAEKPMKEKKSKKSSKKSETKTEGTAPAEAPAK